MTGHPLPLLRALRLFSLVSMTSALAMSTALAQQADVTELETVVVTGNGEVGDGPVGGYVASQSRSGSKTDTPIARTPQTIAVVSKEQIEDQQAESVAEALRYTPGVFTEYRGASNLRDELFVRGFYYTPRFLDGLFLASDQSYAKVDPYLLERVELLSGPASVLYGQTNPGGIVNMVSKKPTDAPYREVGVKLGTDNQYGAFFDVSDKVAGSDTLSYRIAGTGDVRDLQEDFTKERIFAIAPSLTWTPTDQTTLTVLGGYQNEPDAGFRNFLDRAGTIDPIEGFGYVPRDFFVSDPNFESFKREQAWIGYQFEHRFNDSLAVRQNARYHHVEHDQRTLVYGSLSADPATGYDTVISRTASGGPESWGTFTIDNQVEGTVATGAADHTLLAGFDYLHRKRDYVWGRNRSAPSINLADPIYGDFHYSSLVLDKTDDQELTAQQAGLYLQDQIEIGGLTLMAGGRYDWAKTDIDDRLGTNDQAYDDGAFTWRAGAIYNFANGLAPYLSYSTSFEPVLIAAPEGEGAFSPTKAEQIEVGVKYAPEGMPILLTAAYYDLRQKDVVWGAWDPALARTVYSQIGEIHNKGFELSARAEVNANLSLIGSYAYIDSTVEDSPTAGEIDKTPARIPAHQAALWSKYSFTSGALDGLAVGAGIRYVGTSWGNNTNSFEVPAVTLVDASLSYDFGAHSPDLEGLTLQVNAKNIADKTYVASCASAYACFYGSGRSVTATLKKTW
ncbi:TonB-dependent siderophore receptor [Tianweitania populi]|uniref:TonB-dependent receptor n=1 Tax=Tianweitania populi TaxID=1607949 RepID=A0A8J3DTR7_9HYPH|nr:TonB-dependent siderophore receptor [Tianweitania populi]GHD05082.1 TonB-dependent receptor [Tianweitania populi]